MFEQHFEDAEEHAEVVDSTGVGGWVVGHEEEEED